MKLSSSPAAPATRCLRWELLAAWRCQEHGCGVKLQGSVGRRLFAFACCLGLCASTLEALSPIWCIATNVPLSFLRPTHCPPSQSPPLPTVCPPVLSNLYCLQDPSVTRRVLDYMLFMNSKVLFKHLRHDAGRYASHKPVSVHVNCEAGRL